MTSIWVGRHDGRQGDHQFCRASVSPRDSGGFSWLHSYQCKRKPVCTRVVNGHEYGFCKQHDPQEVERLSKERSDLYRRKIEADNQAWQRQKQNAVAMEACKKALEEIAAGHNDPRTLAAETLALFPQ